MKTINIIGAGLSGSEAALYLADAGWKVTLFEMRPNQKTEAHETSFFAELVCSNSFKSNLPTTSSGLLKEEMKKIGCKLLALASQCSVPAGNALAIDREKFGQLVTDTICAHENIRVVREEVKLLPESLTIIATGPLTSKQFTSALLKQIGDNHLYFFDAIAPIVSADSINMDIAYKKSRRDNGDADYINCPFEKDEYFAFVDALNKAEKYESKEFENEFFQHIKFKYYENCTPIEELARRGKETLRYGVLRAIGLENPHTDRRPYAVLQLRAEKNNLTSYNLVGCQTMMRYPEQKRVFRLIPGLENATFERLGSIHRNTYLNTPLICNDKLQIKNAEHLVLAGQLAGVEGYTESIYGGLLAAKIVNDECTDFPEETIIGQLKRHLITVQKNYQPMNSNFGLLPTIPMKRKDKKLKKQLLATRSLEKLDQYLGNQ